MLIALISRLFAARPGSRNARRMRADQALVPSDELKLAGLTRSLGGSAALPFAS